MRNKLILSALLLLGVTIGVQAQSPSGNIKKVWVDHNVYQNGEKGMTIHVEFSVDNMKGKQGSCNAWFFFKDGTKLRNINSWYGTRDGHVATYDNYTPGYESAIYSDFKLFLPYSELHLANGEHDLKFYVGVFDNNNNQFTESDWYNFSLKTGSAAATPSHQSAPVPTQPSASKGPKTTTRENVDGSRTVTTTMECGGCFGSGSATCFNCRGSGQKAIYGYPIYYITCPMCSGSGKNKCAICFGVGVLYMSTTTNPNVPAAVPSGGGFQNTIPAGSSGGGSLGGSVSSSTTCKGCRGSGSCGVCYGAKYRSCGGCGGTGIGSAGSCGACYGAGKNICSGCSGSGNCGTCYGSGTIRY